MMLSQVARFCRFGSQKGAAAISLAARAASTVAAEPSLNLADLVITTKDVRGDFGEKEKLLFGKKFSDHMAVCDWTAEEGWNTPRIMPYGNFSLAPSALVFHYGLECFEGMKAYKGVDGKVRLFRPELNAKRLLRSSKRLALPGFDTDEFVQLLHKLVAIDKNWIPEGRGYSMYLRPTHIATSELLGVAPSDASRLFVITSPVGAYYATGFKPVKLLADPRFVRAWPGGMGDTKCGGNYAPTIQPQRVAAEKGCQQMIWLFGPDHLVTEVGAMNLFMYWKNNDGEDELITAPLDGTILPGVTRDSILDIAREWGEFKVTEGYFGMRDVVKALNEGRVYEIFGAGTAATVSPVGEIHYEGEDLSIPLAHGTVGDIGKRMVDTIFDIQYGVVDHEWAPIVEC